MANTSDYTALNGNLSIAVKALGSAIISGLFATNTLFGLLAVWHGNKNDIVGVGDPSTATILSAAKIPAAIIKEIGDVASYSPILEGIVQTDGKNMTLRDTSATMAQGSGATFTFGLTAGAITTVNVTGGGSGYTGAVPTLVVTDQYGKGAVLEAVTSAGAVTSVTILSGGYNYVSPSMIAYAGNSAGEKFTRPVYKYHHRQETGKVYHSDIDRFAEMARSAIDFKQKTGALVQSSMKTTLSGHISKLSDYMWFGNPADQTADRWSQPAGILQAIDDANTYAGVDRTLAANYYFKAKKDSRALSFTFAQLVEDMMVRKGIADNGGNVDVVLVGPDLYTKYSAEIRAYQQNTNTDDRIRLMGEYGFRSQILKFNNTYLVYDWRCPPNTAIGIDMQGVVIAFKTGKKWATSPLYNQKQVEGGSDADIYYLDTAWMPMFWSPWRCAKYTNLT